LAIVTAGTSETPLGPVLRTCGARMTARGGRVVAAHFGSSTSELAVCQGSVGLTDRCDRLTFEVCGAHDAVAATLERLGPLGERAWGSIVTPGRAFVRCERDVEEGCCTALHGDDDVVIVDVTARYIGLGLVGPRAGEVVATVTAGDPPFRPLVLAEPAGFEILVAVQAARAAWVAVLEAGAPMGIACVGADALDRLAVSRHLVDVRREVHNQI
jgi:glycine cleavage system aminomethyltransferase T